MNRKWFPDKLRGYGGFGSFIRWMVLIVLSVMLVACGSSSGGNEKGSGDGGDSSGGKDETVELTMWTWNRSIDEEAIREYERMNPHITVNLQYADQGDVHNNLITAFSSGSGHRTLSVSKFSTWSASRPIRNIFTICMIWGQQRSRRTTWIGNGRRR